MVIVISNPTPVNQEHTLINALFDEGLEVFHLRKPTYDSYELNELLMKIDQQHHSKIALHQHHELISHVHTRRLHFTERGRSEYQQLVGKDNGHNLTLSTSIHDITTYASLPADFNYCFLAPVFNSISKPEHRSILTIDFNIPAKTSTKLIALGGICSSTIPRVKKYNMDGIAVLGAIWQDTKLAITNFKMLKQQWNS